MALENLQSPVCLLDFEKMQRSILAGVQQCARLGIALRPHVKTAKSTHVLEHLKNACRDAGVDMRGIAVSTLAEAEHFIAAGERDVMYAVEFEPHKLQRVKDLSARAHIKLLTGDPDAMADAAQELPSSVEILALLDVDGERGGLPLGQAASLDRLRERFAQSGGARFGGVATYGGGAYGHEAPDQTRALVAEHVAAVRTLGPVHSEETVSFGGTPATYFASSLDAFTETRIGVFVFGDLFQANLGVCELDDIAVSVLTRVIGIQDARNRVLIDAGGLALSHDRSTQHQKRDFGYGQVCDASGAPMGALTVTNVSQEHGVIELNDTGFRARDFRLGQSLRILPNHVCMTAAGYSGFHVLRNAQPIEFWDRCAGW